MILKKCAHKICWKKMNLEFMLSEVTKSQKKNSYALPQIQNLSNNMYNKSTYEYLITKKKNKKG